MQKLLALLIFALVCTCMMGAEIRAGELWLEVSLQTAKELDLSVPGSISVTDANAIYAKTLEGKLHLSIAQADSIASYRFLDRLLPWNAELESYNETDLKHTAVWDQGRLSFRKEIQHYYPQLFGSRQAALDYSKSSGLSSSRIQALPFSGSSLKIVDAKGETSYFELPVRITSTGYLSPDQGKLSYKGEFVLKAVNGKLQLNQMLKLETYLGGVVQHEIGNNAPPEALKAQTIAARTHAVRLLLYNRHANDGYDLCNGTHCQVYKGEYLQTSAVRDAIDETMGEIMIFNDTVIDATYHSSCGGKTDAASKIWGSAPTPFLSGVTCIVEADSLDLTTEKDAVRWIETKSESTGMSSWEKASQFWTRTIKSTDLAKAVGFSKLQSIEVLERGKSGRIIKLKVSSGDASLILDNEAKIRKAFGGLPSSFFYVLGTSNGKLKTKGELVLHGKGNGHGVGMCQVGALRMSREGTAFDLILGHYYPGTEITIDWIQYED